MNAELHNRKILFTDLDGTLLNDQKQISEGNRTAIQEALALGHSIVISTGRALESGKALARKLGLTMPGCYIIAFNGACIYDIGKNRILASCTIPMNYVRTLFQEARRQSVHIQTYDDTQVICEQENEHLRRYCRDTSLGWKTIPSISDLILPDPPKVLAIDYDQHEKLVHFQESIHSWAQGKVDSYFSSDSLLEIVAPGVSKGHAIRTLCDWLQIPLEDTISAGDADNDISMLQTTHISVVMKNAAPHMRQYATYVTERDHNHDGIAEVIYRFMIPQHE